MPWTVCPGERRCSEPLPLVKAGVQLPAGHRCCPLLSPASCPDMPQGRLVHGAIVGRGRRHRRLRHGGAGGSPVPGPTLGGDSSTWRGCTGRAGCRSHRRRRFGRCRSYAPAGRSSGRDAFPPLAPSCLERPLRQSRPNLACPATLRACQDLNLAPHPDQAWGR